MLGFLHEAEPYGHFVIGGAAPSDKEVSFLVGASAIEAKKCLAELKAAGVFSTNSEGVIYSCRMVRDRDKAERNRINGATGGNPQLTPSSRFKDGPGLTPSSAELDHGVNGLDNGGVNPPHNPSDKAAHAHVRAVQKPDTRTEDSEGSIEPSAAGAALDPQKEVFDRGKAILGRNASGMITTLLRDCDGNCRRAVGLLRLAESKSDPREYLGAILRGDVSAKSEEVLAQTERLYRDLGVS